METIFMNTDNSNTNEPHRFRLHYQINLILKVQIKAWHWKFQYLLYMENIKSAYNKKI